MSENNLFSNTEPTVLVFLRNKLILHGITDEATHELIISLQPILKQQLIDAYCEGYINPKSGIEWFNKYQEITTKTK